MRFYTNAYYNYKAILLAEKDENGKTVYSEKEHSPSVYLPSRDRCDLKSINGEPLMRMKLDKFQDQITRRRQVLVYTNGTLD